MVSRAHQCLCVVQGAPGGKARSLPWEAAGEAAGEGAGSTEMPSDVLHRPLDATKTLPHRPCPLCPRPGQASASSHLPGLVAEPVDPHTQGEQQAPVPVQTTQGRPSSPCPALDTCSPRRGQGSTVLGTMVGAWPRQSGHCPASVRLTWANTHTQTLPSSGSNHSSFLAPTSSSVKGGNV